MADLLWAKESCKKLADMPDPRHNLAAWLDRAAAFTHEWISIVKQIAADCTQSSQAATSYVQPDPPAQHTWACYSCGSMHASRRSLATHAARAHGHESPAANAMFSTTCIACMKQFHTRPRLVAHLLHSTTKCLEAILSSTQPPSSDVKAQLLEEERQRARAHRKAPGVHSECHRPVLRLQGPLPQWAAQVLPR